MQHAFNTNLVYDNTSLFGYRDDLPEIYRSVAFCKTHDEKHDGDDSFVRTGIIPIVDMFLETDVPRCSAEYFPDSVSKTIKI